MMTEFSFLSELLLLLTLTNYISNIFYSIFNLLLLLNTNIHVCVSSQCITNVKNILVLFIVSLLMQLTNVNEIDLIVKCNLLTLAIKALRS